MSEVSIETGSGESAHDPLAATDRRCIACGYNLRGLGVEPRCPECGLVHVTAQFRQQVWDLVDSGKWFFSGVYTPFRKRLPGWWWALDREGDVSRSFRSVGRNILLAAIITGQLVRSRWHASRIILMYAIVVPACLLWAFAAAVFLWRTG